MRVTASYIRELLVYDMIFGDFVWRFREGVPAWWNTKYAGKIAGSEDADGYWIIRIDRKTYKAHRLAWVYVTGEDLSEEIEIDHRNGCRKDNGFFNLRKADNTQNAVNAGLRHDNQSGFKGVSWHKHRRRWQAQINERGKRKSLGYFESAEVASRAYQIRAEELHGEFVRKMV